MAKKTVKKRVTFQLHAPGAGSVCVAGDFNDWNTGSMPLKAATGGETHTWQRIMYLEPGTYHYRFVVDGAWWDDPHCAERRGNEFGTEDAVLRVHPEKPAAPKKKTKK